MPSIEAISFWEAPDSVSSITVRSRGERAVRRSCDGSWVLGAIGCGEPACEVVVSSLLLIAEMMVMAADAVEKPAMAARSAVGRNSNIAGIPMPTTVVMLKVRSDAASDANRKPIRSCGPIT